MIVREELKIELNGKSSKHILSSNVKSNNLAILFPGAGSNTRTPYFYYMRYYFLRAGYDVLASSYENIVDQNDTFDEKMNKIAQSIHKGIEKSQESKTIEKFIFVSTSIGSIISEKVRSTYEYKDIISIYTSPTSLAIKEISKYPGLVITSTDDDMLKEGDLDIIKSFPKHEVVVFEDGDHRLECFDTLKTIDYCSKAVEATIEYIKKQGTSFTK